MEKTYTLGPGKTPVNLNVNMITDGLAASVVSLLTLPAGDFVDIARSKDATGDISAVVVGATDELKGKRLQVFATVVIPGTFAATRKAIADATTAEYILDGGADGEKKFTPSTIKFRDPKVYVELLVDFV